MCVTNYGDIEYNNKCTINFTLYVQNFYIQFLYKGFLYFLYAKHIKIVIMLFNYNIMLFVYFAIYNNLILLLLFFCIL